MLAQIHTHAHWALVSVRLGISEAPPTLAFCKPLKEGGNCITGAGPVREETSNLKSFPYLQCSVWTTQQTSNGYLSVQSLVEGRDLSRTRAGADAGRNTLPERPLSLAGSVLWLPSEASPGSRVLGEKALFAQNVCCCLRPARPLDTVPSWLALTFPLLGGRRALCHRPSIRVSWEHRRHLWPRALPPAPAPGEERRLLPFSCSLVLQRLPPASFPFHVSRQQQGPKLKLLTSSPPPNLASAG